MFYTNRGKMKKIAIVLTSVLVISLLFGAGECYAVETETNDLPVSFVSGMKVTCGGETPVKQNEEWKEGQGVVPVYYCQKSATVSLDTKGDVLKGATIHIGTSENGAEKVWTTQTLEEDALTFSREFSEDGRYEVSFWVEQKDGTTYGKEEATKGDDNSYTKRFIIDQVAPVFSISGVEEGECYKETVALSLKVSEEYHAYDRYQVRITRKMSDGMQDEQVQFFEEEAWTKTEEGIERRVEISDEGSYEIELSGCDIAGNQGDIRKVSFVMDHTAPEVIEVVYSDAGGILKSKYDTIFSNQEILIEMRIHDNVSVLSENNIFATIGSEDKQYNVKKVSDEVFSISVPKSFKKTLFQDGIKITVTDDAGNQTSKKLHRVVYSKEKPVITIKSNKKTKSWTKKNISFDTDIVDEQSGLQEVVFFVNEKEVQRVTFSEYKTKYHYNLVADENAEEVTGYKVRIEAVNNCGTKSVVKKTVYIDKEKPVVTLSGIKNGEHYKAFPTLITKVSDISYKDTKTVYYVKCTMDGVKKKVSLADFDSKDYEDTCARKITQEGYYEIYAITTDGAGNRTKTDTLQFVVDLQAPKLTVSGVQNGTVSQAPVDITISCEESFFETNDVKIQVEKTLNGKTEAIPVDAFPKTRKNGSIAKNFSADGVYKIHVSAKDRAGNTAEKETITFSIDQTKPVLQINGTDNYQLWDKAPTLEFVVEESFYQDDVVTISGTRMDMDGKVEEIEMPAFMNSGLYSRLAQTFETEGIYELSLHAKDKAGNEADQMIHFTVDKSKPVIEGIQSYDGGYYQQFRIGDSIEEMFKDLTVISYRMLLDGIEYDGASPIEEEGKHTLEVEVSDELGHVSNEVIEFIVDRTAPKVIFQGVKDGESVKEPGTVNLSLMDEEDEITAIRMNNEGLDVSLRSIPFTEYGDYNIEVDCVDKAGNMVTRSVKFSYVNPVIRVLLVCGLALLIIAICGWLCLATWLRNRKVEDK